MYSCVTYRKSSVSNNKILFSIYGPTCNSPTLLRINQKPKWSNLYYKDLILWSFPLPVSDYTPEHLILIEETMSCSIKYRADGNTDPGSFPPNISFSSNVHTHIWIKLTFTGEMCGLHTRWSTRQFAAAFKRTGKLHCGRVRRWCPRQTLPAGHCSRHIIVLICLHSVMWYTSTLTAHQLMSSKQDVDTPPPDRWDKSEISQKTCCLNFNNTEL